MAHSKDPVYFINVFDGLPVQHEAVVLDVGTNCATFKVHKYQIVCLLYDKHTFIQSDFLPKMIRGRVLSLDVCRGIALLDDFVRVDRSIGMRELIRVQPLERLEIEIATRNFGKLRGILADISREGIGVHVNPKLIVNSKIVGIGTIVSLTIQFPLTESDVPRSLTVCGRVVRRINDREKNLYRVGFRLTHDAISEATIAAYINQRESEIIREIKTKYDDLLRKYSD